MSRLRCSSILRAGVSFHFGTSELKPYPFIDDFGKSELRRLREWCKPWKYCTTSWCHMLCTHSCRLGTVSSMNKAQSWRRRREQTVLWTGIAHTHIHKHAWTNGRQADNEDEHFICRPVYTLPCAKNGDESTVDGGGLLVLALVSGVTDSHMDLICCSVFLRASCQKADPHNPHCRQ